MCDTVIKVENLSKLYRVGQIGTGTLSHDLNRWWARVRGREDPFAKVGHVNDRTQKAEKGETVWALKDINFEVKQGEVLGIIGKNGAGKSTLLKLLSRVTSPTTGEVKLMGRVASLLEVGTGFHDEMTGRENIYMNGTIMGMTRREIAAKLDDIVDFAGVAKYLDTPVKRYSSGMKVRLGFAVAAFLEPEILIVDEVLAVGDAEFQRRAIGKMREMSKGGERTVLFVSHNMDTIKALCQNGILLEDGQINSYGKIIECIDHYLNNNIQNIHFQANTKNGYALEHFQFIGEDGYNSIKGDSSLVIKGTIKGKCTTDKPYLIIHIRNRHNNKIILLSSRLSQIEIGLFQDHLSFNILIKKINLMPGRYYIDLSLLALGGYTIVKWEKILELNIVAPVEFANISLPNESNRGIVYVETKWETWTV